MAVDQRARDEIAEVRRGLDVHDATCIEKNKSFDEKFAVVFSKLDGISLKIMTREDAVGVAMGSAKEAARIVVDDFVKSLGINPGDAKDLSRLKDAVAWSLATRAVAGGWLVKVLTFGGAALLLGAVFIIGRQTS